ncbi:MAG: MFS transporter, partial [Acidobacteria bacterium]|nr:MFS transporter [Acidobacteriota bacterium]
ERWRVHDNTVRPHASLGDRPPAPIAYRLAMPQPSASRSPVSPVMETLIPTGTKHRAGQILMGMVYIQMYNSLSVYLRDQHGIQPKGYGLRLSASAVTVICFQIWTMRVIKTRPQFPMMAFGTLFYMIGFGMFGVVSAYWLFVLAVVIVTIGEMIVMPTSQALAASFARIDMRGRYMAAYGLCVSVPAALGPAAAGIVIDHYNPDLLWYLGALLCAISAGSFYALHIRLGAQPRFAPAAAVGNSPMVMEAEHG